MSRRLLALIAAVASVAAFAIAVGAPAGIVAEILVAAAAVIGAVRLLGRPAVGPDPFELALPDRRAPRHDPFADLRRQLRVSLDSAVDAHRLLRPLLRDAATARLRLHGIELDRDAQTARSALGDSLYDLIRPDRPRPDADAAPWTRNDLDDAIRRLEQL